MVDIKNAYFLLNTGLPCATIQIGMKERPWQIKLGTGNTEGSLEVENIEIVSTVENQSSICTIVLNRPQINYDKISGNLKVGAEVDLINQGEEISVKLGYTDMSGINILYDAFEGFIASTQISYGENGATVVIECMDAKMWMMAGCRSVEKTGDKYSSIVKSVFQPYTCTQKVREGEIKIREKGIPNQEEPTLNQSIYQSNESDYQFLCRLAEITGCLFFIYLGEAYFVGVGTCGSPIGLSLSPCRFVRNITWKTDVLGLSSKIVVNGVDPLNPSKEVKSKDVKTNLGNIGKENTTIGSDISSKIDKTTDKIVQCDSVDTASYAQFVAQSKFTRESIKFVECVVEIYGYTSKIRQDFKLGMGVRISGWGDNIDNIYILTGIKHKYKRGEFLTELTLATDTCPKRKVI